MQGGLHHYVMATAYILACATLMKCESGHGGRDTCCPLGWGCSRSIQCGDVAHGAACGYSRRDMLQAEAQLAPLEVRWRGRCNTLSFHTRSALGRAPLGAGAWCIRAASASASASTSASASASSAKYQTRTYHCPRQRTASARWVTERACQSLDDRRGVRWRRWHTLVAVRTAV